MDFKIMEVDASLDISAISIEMWEHYEESTDDNGTVSGKWVI